MGCLASYGNDVLVVVVEVDEVVVDVCRSEVGRLVVAVVGSLCRSGVGSSVVFAGRGADGTTAGVRVAGEYSA